MYDVIVIGSGHQGLTCAAYLARAGQRVAVLEAQPFIGGMTMTHEPVPEAPGFKMSGCAVDTILIQVPRSIVHELELARYGLRFVTADPYCSWLGPDGDSIALWRDLDRTAKEIARFSRKDAVRYHQFANIVCDAWYATLPYLQDHPRRPSLRTIGEMAVRAARTRRSLAPALRIMAQSPMETIEEWFESDQLRTAMAHWALAGMNSLETPGGSAVLAMFMMTHRWGCTRPVGGMGALSGALAACVEAHGGHVRAGVPVREIVVGSGRASGVVLDSGELVEAVHVVGALDPTTLMTKLLDPGLLPVQTQDELRGMSVIRNNMTLFKGDVAITTEPRFPRHHGRDDDFWRGGYIMLAPDFDYVRRSITATARGELAEEIPVWVSMPTKLDRTLVPAGSDGHSLYVYVPAVPYELAGGLTWPEVKEAYLSRCLDVLEQYAPGVTGTIIGKRASKSPSDLEKLGYKGHILHVDMSPAQIGPWRPIPSMSGYRTPIDGLWHTAGGAHPVPTVNGWSGRTSARTILKVRRLEARGGAATRRGAAARRRAGAPPAPNAQAAEARAPVGVPE
jgi:beta-carotene ketolase (CrtO type)